MRWRGTSTEQAPTLNLPDALREIRANIAQYVPREKREINERAIAAVRATGAEQQIVSVGAVSPEFTLPDGRERPVSSRELLARGPLVLLFVRGRWDPFCVATLEAYNHALLQFQAAGASLAAISPMLPRHCYFTVDQHKLKFPLLSDMGNAVARQFKLAYRLPEEQIALYKSVFVNLPQQNGDDSWELPLAAAYVVGQDGTIRFARASADYRERAAPEELLPCVAEANAQSTRQL